MQEQIKTLRKTLGLTQQEFADRLAIKRNTIANYEIGRNEPIDAVVSLICKTFSVNESWLRTGEGEMFVQAKEDLFARLAAEGLDDFGIAALKVYLRLKPDQQKVLRDFFVEVAAESADASLAAEVDAEMAAELAAEREERIVERGTPMSDPSTVSSAG